MGVRAARASSSVLEAGLTGRSARACGLAVPHPLGTMVEVQVRVRAVGRVGLERRAYNGNAGTAGTAVSAPQSIRDTAWVGRRVKEVIETAQSAPT